MRPRLTHGVTHPDSIPELTMTELEQFLLGYFHQDCFLDHKTSAEIITFALSEMDVSRGEELLADLDETWRHTRPSTSWKPILRSGRSITIPQGRGPDQTRRTRCRPSPRP